MDKKNNAQYVIDELASQAGGYFSVPTQEDIAYTDLLLMFASNLASDTIRLLLRKKLLSKR